MTVVYIAIMPNGVIGGVFETEELASQFISQKARKRGTDIGNYKILIRKVREKNDN